MELTLVCWLMSIFSVLVLDDQAIEMKRLIEILLETSLVLPQD